VTPTGTTQVSEANRDVQVGEFNSIICKPTTLGDSTVQRFFGNATYSATPKWRMVL
jgi:hypothetical protein